MLKDRYDNPLTTSVPAARDAYVEGVDLLLAAGVGGDVALDRAIAADPGFAMAHVAKSRLLYFSGDGRGARAALAKAQEHAGGLTPREASQLDIMHDLTAGRSDVGFDKAKAHLVEHPRDIMVAQPCLGVFGLIGFSGRAGREDENLAFARELAPHYGDDWWFTSALAFAEMEAGEIAPAEKTIEIALRGNPRNANASHYRAHLYYELGETDAGLAYLTDWMEDYPKEGLMHCHNAWHIALWALAKGDVDRMWEVVDRDVDPRSAWGPSINVLTDIAAILYRAELAGVEVPGDRWRVVSDYAAKCFPKPGIAFVDVHAALAHAMAGNAEGVERIIEGAKGGAADLVQGLAHSFRALVRKDWAETAEGLNAAMQDHARIGGSRAQRDLLEYAYAAVLMRMGQSDTAAQFLHKRRPMTDYGGAIAGLVA